MSAAVGTRLGPYEITARIGVGGMGEVYRATDTKLGREVAIKTLPSALALDPDRLARFEREAKLLAALNHAHIASVYGLDDQDGTRFLAMELVDGETLEDKLKNGALPIEQALEIALQIAEALEAAHEKGVVHRDLKPANVMLTRTGVVKVLDFGLAKAFAGDPNEASPAHSPALSLAMTQAGLILGTAGYMSPEQASGQAADQRADVWAFGVLVFEMLSGLPLFGGESVPHILADVLRSDPDWNRLPKSLHPRLRLMLERCLEKKPRKRYHSIADARVDIEAVLADPEGAALAQGAGASGAAAPYSRAIWVSAAALVAALAGVAIGRLTGPPGSTPEPPVTRFAVDLEGTLSATEPIALSPDGRRIVYAANNTLYSRRMDQDAATAIPGTEGAVNPFFAPDGQSVAFFTNSLQLKAVGFGGDAPRVLADLDLASGLVGSWDAQGRIIFGRFGAYGLSVVAAVGGAPAPLAEIGDYRDVDYPDVLPGGDWVLFTADIVTGDWGGSDIVAQRIATGERKVVLSGGHFARYLPTGHLVYTRHGVLYAVTFDPERVETTGAPVPVVQGVRTSDASGHAGYAVSATGTLVYAPGVGSGDSAVSPIVRVDRTGGANALSETPRNYRWPRVSPDGTRVAVTVDDPAAGGSQIWIISLATGSATQLTFDTGFNGYPLWTSNGAEILYVARGEGDKNRVHRTAADGSGSPELVIEGSADLVPTDVTPDGMLVYQERGAAADTDIFVLALDGSAQPQPFLATPATEQGARISPNGQWMAYLSDQSGLDRVYVRPYPATQGGQRAISESLGRNVAWDPRGDTIYFMSSQPYAMTAAHVDYTAGSLVVGEPQVLFDFAAQFKYVGMRQTATYDVLPDGEGFVAVMQEGLALPGEEGGSTSAPRLNVVLNWFTELERLAPTR